MPRLLALIVVLIAYGSFYPWNFAESPGGFRASVRYLLDGGGGLYLRDLFFNVLFYIPVGVVAFLSFRTRLRPVSASLAAVLLGTALSIFVEVVQGYESSRRTSIYDVYANAAGSILGVAVASIFSTASDLLHQPGKRRHDAGALALIVLWMGYLLCPFLPVLTERAIAAKLTHARDFSLVPFISAAVVWFVAGNAMRGAGLGHARLLCGISVLFVPLQIFLLRRQPTIADLAGAIAGCLSFAYVRDRGAAIRAAAWATLSLIVFRGLWPIEFANAPQAFGWAPFIGLLNIDWYQASEVLAVKLFLYAAAIWCLRENGMRLRTAAALTASVLMVIELSQIWLARTPEITDPLLALMIGIGMDAFRHESRRTSSPSETLV